MPQCLDRTLPSLPTKCRTQSYNSCLGGKQIGNYYESFKMCDYVWKKTCVAVLQMWPTANMSMSVKPTFTHADNSKKGGQAASGSILSAATTTSHADNPKQKTASSQLQLCNSFRNLTHTSHSSFLDWT